MSAAISLRAAQDLGLQIGFDVYASIRATSGDGVMVRFGDGCRFDLGFLLLVYCANCTKQPSEFLFRTAAAVLKGIPDVFWLANQEKRFLFSGLLLQFFRISGKFPRVSGWFWTFYTENMKPICIFSKICSYYYQRLTSTGSKFY